jgi:PTS system fructose-specific IIC component
MADYTRPELIIPRLHESDPAGIIKELSQRLFQHAVIGDVLPFYDAAFNHDLLTNSALPVGIAIPHARSAYVRQLTMAIGRAHRPVVWGIKRSWSVDHVFLIAVPATDALDYLALLSSIASLGHQPERLAQLRAMTDARGIFKILKAINVRPAETEAPHLAFCRGKTSGHLNDYFDRKKRDANPLKTRLTLT